MILDAVEVKFRERREPFPYDMSDRPGRDGQPGPKGVSYSFLVIDHDESKVKIKCSEEVWNRLADVPKGATLLVRLDVSEAKVFGPDGLEVLEDVDAFARS